MQNSVLVGILITLLSKKKVGLYELSLKYEVSSRTVIRYIDALSEGGVPIVSFRGRNGGYSILDSFRLSSMYFTPTEYDRLIACVEAMPIDEIGVSVLDKLKGLRKNESSAFSSSVDKIVIDTSFSPAFENKFNALSRATKNNQLTQITYHDKFGLLSIRDIEPLKFVYKDNVWYIYAYCRTREDFRFFKINRISGVKLFDENFNQRDYCLDTKTLNEFLKEREHIDLTISLEAEILAEVQEWLGEDSLIKKGTGYMAFASVPYDDFLINKLLTFGDKIKVIKPTKLIASFSKKLDKLLKYYNTL